LQVLFFQQAVKGLYDEFTNDMVPDYSWRLVNGLWSLFLAFGVTLSALLLRTARRWRFLNAPLRSFLADYGSAGMVVAWSGLSFAVTGTPEGVPSRIAMPNTWDVKTGWSTATVRATRCPCACLCAASPLAAAWRTEPCVRPPRPRPYAPFPRALALPCCTQDLHRVPAGDAALAAVPAMLIALLFFFDHAVSAQLAQQPEFGLRKPSAYHYDFALLGALRACCVHAALRSSCR
jgi:hypothetical protein